MRAGRLNLTVMGGYTPLFDSLTTGTLCGRWPDVGLWPIVLSLADRHGVVDFTPSYLARVTGLGIDEITACMNRFCKPDSDSRSSDEGGARLVLIDPDHRDWGWRVVNHAKYREKARKRMQQIEATASGRDADRKRRERERRCSGDVQRSPAKPEESSADRPSDSDSDSDANKDKRQRPQKRPRPASFHAEVIAAYHELLPGLAAVKGWTEKREQALDARINERCKDGKPADSIVYWREFFERVAASDFLCGRSGDFVASLEWLLRPEIFLRTIEGAYDKRNRSNGDRTHG